MQAMRAYSNQAAMLCAGTFILLLATAVSNVLRLDVDTGDATVIDTIGQFMLPALPLGLALVLLALGGRAAATVVAALGTLFYLFDWIMLGA